MAERWHAAWLTPSAHPGLGRMSLRTAPDANSLTFPTSILSCHVHGVFFRSINTVFVRTQRDSANIDSWDMFVHISKSFEKHRPIQKMPPGHVEQMAPRNVKQDGTHTQNAGNLAGEVVVSTKHICVYE